LPVVTRPLLFQPAGDLLSTAPLDTDSGQLQRWMAPTSPGVRTPGPIGRRRQFLRFVEGPPYL
jgi:hypothetical protein